MRRALPALLLALALAGCGGDLATPGERLRVFGDTLPPAFVGERYEALVRAVGGLRPFTYELSAGTLPPGLAFEGGALRGVPEEVGSWEFTVTVTDANLSQAVQRYRLAVREPPPARLVLLAPETEVRRPVAIRAEVQDARGLRALRTAVRWDPERFRLVEGSVRAARSDLALLWEAAEGRLQVDAALLGATLDGAARLYAFELEPLAPSRLSLEQETEFVLEGGRHAFARGVAGAPVGAESDEEDPAGAGPDDAEDDLGTEPDGADDGEDPLGPDEEESP